MRATVIKAFQGAEDGKVHPRTFKIGDTVEGELAKVAIAEKWATTESKDAKQPEKKTETKKSETKAETKTDKIPLQIPADWKTFTSDKLKDLAKLLTGADVKDDAAAKAAIEAEVAKRTPKA